MPCTQGACQMMLKESSHCHLPWTLPSYSKSYTVATQNHAVGIIHLPASHWMHINTPIDTDKGNKPVCVIAHQTSIVCKGHPFQAMHVIASGRPLDMKQETFTGQQQVT